MEQLLSENLDSFRHMTDVWPEPKPKRQRGRKCNFEPWQLALADRLAEQEDQAA
jgi:hypothetical protein